MEVMELFLKQPSQEEIVFTLSITTKGRTIAIRRHLVWCQALE
jgi:hypothetical protein